MNLPEDVPPLTGSAVLDPWRIRHRLDLRGLLEPEPRRTAPTRSEVLLWQALEPRPEGWLREYSTGPYRLDFFCPALRLAVEVDGGSHYGRAAADKDELRDQWHALRGITTRRFSANHVERDVGGVRAEIADAVAARLASSSPPLVADQQEPELVTGQAAVAAVVDEETMLVTALDHLAAVSSPAQQAMSPITTVSTFEADVERAALDELAACRTVLPERTRRQLLRLIAG